MGEREGFSSVACGDLFGGSGHFCGAVELVPGEGFAVYGALHRLEKDYGEDLAVGEALDPDVEEEPKVALAGGVFALEQEGQAGGHEVNEEEAEKKGEELVEAGRGGGVRMEVAVDDVMEDAENKHEVDERRDEGQKNLEDQNVGQGEEAHGAAVADGELVFVERLEDAEGPAEALAHEAVGVDGGFREGEGLVFVDDGVTLFEEVHGEVGVFGNGVGVVAVAILDGGGAPGADGSGNDHDDVEEVQSAAFEILRGDVFEGLPAGPEVDAIADFGITGDGSNLRIGEVRDQAGNCVVSDDAVGVDADVDLFVDEVQGRS